MKRWAGLCLLGIVLSWNAKAMEAVVSYTHFYLPGDAKPYIELSWQIYPASLRFTKDTTERFISKIKTDVIIKAGDKLLREEHFILQTVPAATIEAAKIQNVIDLHRYMAAYGNINAEVVLTDLVDTTNTFTWNEDITIDTPAAGKPFYSGIQLLDTFYTSTTKSIYLKNYKYQLPLNANFIDDNRNSLKFYAELLQTDKVTKDDYPLIQHVYISKKPSESAVYKLINTDTIAPAAILPYLGSFKIDVLPSGNYYLNFDLRNSNRELVASRSIFFQRSNRSPVSLISDSTSTDSMEQVNIFDLGNTFVSKFNVSQLKAILKMVEPVSTPVETENIKTLLRRHDLVYMQYFVYNFWSNRNKKDPERAWNEYADKVREVNKIFGRRAYEGDRGHIYLRYGKPTERVIVENEQGSLPYEVWQYNETDKMSNALFLFYRPSFMIGDMQLLHSNVPGEARTLDWRTYLYQQGTSNSDHSNARVEQYFYKR